MCYKWPRISLIYCNCNSVLSSFVTSHWFVTRIARRVPLEEQKLLTPPEQMNSHLICRFSFLFSVFWIRVCLFVHFAVVCLSNYGILITPSECNLDYCCYSMICNMCYRIFIKATKICMNVCPIHYKPYGTSKWIYHNVLTSQERVSWQRKHCIRILCKTC